jgi:hypothetical protein
MSLFYFKFQYFAIIALFEFNILAAEGCYSQLLQNKAFQIGHNQISVEE